MANGTFLPVIRRGNPWSDTVGRWPTLSDCWDRSAKWLVDANSILSDQAHRIPEVACVLASGSLGRMEATLHSDADLLIVLRPTSQLSVAEAESTASVVQQLVAPLGLRGANPTGIYANCIWPADLWRSDQGVLSPDPCIYGPRIQMLLDSNMAWEAEPTNSASLFQQSLQWFAAGAMPGEPWWTYWLDEIQRYFRSLRLLWRNKPAAESPQRLQKLNHSRYLTWAAVVSLIGTSAACESGAEAMTEQLTVPPQQRILNVFERYHFAAEPWLDAYEQFLSAAQQNDWTNIDSTPTLKFAPKLAQIFHEFLEQRKRDWPPLFFHHLLF
ncbi:MAG: DUF294 nucleotidyltransferase-like domain-containing protein [Planctomycetota bacterium]|nr:DUF294 nucleotidyltransferase-like domain-containing protein [Planctomycetota bacterium]MDA1178935.1 DUF294 nucleotidyltransferase-like domain-containing protein [Planctomycetota bacterium]